MRCLEFTLVMTVDCRLPEELHEACKTKRIVIVWLQKFAVNLLHQKLELVLVQHWVIHIVLPVHFHKIRNCDDLFTQGAVSSVLLFEYISFSSIFVKEEAEQCGILLENKAYAVFFTIFFSAIKFDKNVFLFRCDSHWGTLARNQGYSSLFWSTWIL